MFFRYQEFRRCTELLLEVVQLKELRLDVGLSAHIPPVDQLGNRWDGGRVRD